jgi:hypothetical protein
MSVLVTSPPVEIPVYIMYVYSRGVFSVQYVSV